LTTDGWAGNNKLDCIAVTGHWKTKLGEHNSVLLDIIELTSPVHDDRYLCKELLGVTNRLGITFAVMSVTRDNASQIIQCWKSLKLLLLHNGVKWKNKIGYFFCC
jgi:hypothetical protein